MRTSGELRKREVGAKRRNQNRFGSIVFTVAALAFAILAAPAPGLADVTATEEFSYDLNPGGSLSVETINGDISVRAGSGNTVRITAYKKGDNQEYLDGIEVRISADEDRIRVRTELPERDGGWFGFNQGNGSVSYEITAPASTNLDSIDTVNGEIDIEGIAGDVNADTTNGDINVSGLRGSFRGSGEVRRISARSGRRKKFRRHVATFSRMARQASGAISIAYSCSKSASVLGCSR